MVMTGSFVTTVAKDSNKDNAHGNVVNAKITCYVMTAMS